MEIAVSSPFPFASLPRVWRWIDSFKHKVADDFGPKTLEEFMADMQAKWERLASWAVYADGELGGLVTFDRLSPWLGTAHMLLKPELQGKGITARAARPTLEAMFQTGVGKLAFFPLAGNLALGSMLSSLGAKREGLLKGHTVCGGKPADVVVYGLTRESFLHAYRSSSSGDCVLTDRSGVGDRGVGNLGGVAHLDGDQPADVHA